MGNQGAAPPTETQIPTNLYRKGLRLPLGHSNPIQDLLPFGEFQLLHLALLPVQ